MASGSIDTDERLANMIHRQQLQQKEDMDQLAGAPSVSHARAEFRRGLEELVRDHFHTCMTLASCSSAHDSGLSGRHDHFHENHDDDDEEEGDQLVRRRRRSNMEEDYAESSAARRRQSRILTRWAARQAQEMITTMERQNRESELLALAGLHAVSMLDSSFLRESSASRTEGAVERPSTRASSLLQMWREIEEEQRGDRARGRMRARMAHSEVPETRREHTHAQSYHENANIGRESSVSNSNTNTLTHESNQQRNTSQDGGDHFEDGQWIVVNQNGNESPDVGDRREEFRDWEDGQLDSENGSREQSPELEESERERVTQIDRGWMTGHGITESASNMTNSNSRRAELLGENGRERVRLAREWVHMTSQQRDAQGSRREQSHGPDVQPGLVRRQARQREGIQEGLVAELEETEPEHVNRDALRLRGRQAIMDLLVRIGRERQRELQRLMEHRAVSDFAHRNRIQSLLRGRFLRTGPPTEEERPPSLAARELGQLRQRRTVSGLRLESIVRGQDGSHSNGTEGSNSTSFRNSNSSGLGNDQTRSAEVHGNSLDPESNQPGNRQDPGGETGEIMESDNVRRDHQDEVDMEGEGRDSQVDATQSVDGNLQENESEEGVQEWQEATEPDSPRGWQDDSENAERDWQGDPNQNVNRDQQESGNQNEDENWQGNASHNVERDWHEDASEEVIREWQEGPSQRVGRDWGGIATTRRVNNFQSAEDAHEYNMELRELLGRRSVSTVLASEFRESLDQLIRSYVERQSRNPVTLDLERPVQRATMQEEDPEQQEGEDQNGNLNNTTHVPVLPPPRRVVPPPPPPPPRQPYWHPGTAWASTVLPPPAQSAWTRHTLQRSDVEWEIINDLRTEMTQVQQGMINMQRMLEACMDMQLELQRSVRQEVSAALNRSNEGQSVPDDSIDGSKWVTVRKGMCCACCDNHIDSLLYRCGHMCTCLKCATELLHNSGKCPMCRAPIVEVVRAYCVM